MARDLAIVLNNGGVNAAVATALAAQKYRTVLLYAEADPQPGSRSRSAYDQQVAHFKPYRDHTLSMPFLSALSGPRAAASPADPRHPAPVGPQMLELLPLIAAAARFAAHYQATALYLGLRVGGEGRVEGRGEARPDARSAGSRVGGQGMSAATASSGASSASSADGLAQATEFLQIWNEMLEHPCGQPELTVEAPLLELEPWQVVDVGFQAQVPFERTWSCQDEGPEPCWACRGCRTREAAFQQAAKPDPLRTVRRA